MTKPKARARGPAVLIAMFSIPVNQLAKSAAASLPFTSLVRSKGILLPALPFNAKPGALPSKLPKGNGFGGESFPAGRGSRT